MIYDPWCVKTENIYGHKKRLEFIMDVIETQRKENRMKVEEVNLLDVGCGTGVMITLPLASIGYRIVGVDTGYESIKTAREINTYNNLSFICESIENIKFGNMFDIILCSEVLEHLSNPATLIQNIKKLLKNDGYLIITVPNGYGWFEFESFLWDKLKIGYVLELFRITSVISKIKKFFIGTYIDCEYPSTISSSPHVQRFTLKKIKLLLEQCEFHVTKVMGSTLIAGKFSNLFFTGIDAVMEFNNRIGSAVPRFASGFYLVGKLSIHNMGK